MVSPKHLGPPTIIRSPPNNQYRQENWADLAAGIRGSGRPRSSHSVLISLAKKQKEDFPMRCYALAITVFLSALLALACADPAANKPKASVGEATAEKNAPKQGGETLTISPENSKIDFVAAKVTRSHNGSFKQFSGTIDLLNSDPLQSVVSISIDTSSVVTDEPDLTKHLQTPDFFDVGKFPKANFVSTKIEPSTANGATHSITGNFDFHGIKKSINFPATIQVAPASISVNAEFAINRKDFGLVYPGKADDLIKDGVVIKLALSVPRKP
jgi:polyisoprenoid-binding protein YceI